MIAIHPYIRYAQALIMAEKNLSSCDEITPEHIIAEIEKSFESFRVYPVEDFSGKDSVKYNFCKTEKGNTFQGIFLSPNVISSDINARHIWNEGLSLIEKMKHESPEKMGDIAMSIAPSAGEYLSFSMQNNAGRGKPKMSLMEQGLSAITTLTQYKPCLQYLKDKKGSIDMFNICIIPDLPINEMKDFISFFKRMRMSRTESDLMKGKVKIEEKGKGDKKTVTYIPRRPLIFKGNFPNPPRSSALGSIALLGAIGELAKEEEYSAQAKKILDSLKNTEIYLVKYGGATVFTYNHHVIDLAKESKLKIIIDSLYYSQLFNQERRAGKNIEYQKFDMFTSRFLQLFNHASFKDFLAFRAEYPNPVTILFTTYFIKMENIDPKIVTSAKILGKWLNKVAYWTAKSEIKEGEPNYWESLRKVKSKVLVELESSTFSAKSGDALIAQAVIRAGRLSGLDAPEGAALFMEKTISGELPLENAKNLLIAFSRLINKSEKNEKIENSIQIDEDDIDNENLNNNDV